jgi:hypothetical protein
MSHIHGLARARTRDETIAKSALPGTRRLGPEVKRPELKIRLTDDQLFPERFLDLVHRQTIVDRQIPSF